MQRKVRKRLGKSHVAEGEKKKKKEKQSNPFTRFEAYHLEGIMSSSHEGVPDPGSALTAGLFVCPF